NCSAIIEEPALAESTIMMESQRKEAFRASQEWKNVADICTLSN
ncbi:29968_t:CDS:2, partial [Racocetra persica]